MKAKERANKITSFYYFTGDYTNTYKAVKESHEAASNKTGYHLLFDNCVERTLSAFCASDARFLSIYKNDITDIVPNLVASRVAMLPSNKNEFPFQVRWLLAQ